MNLQENISRIKEVMGVNESEIPNSIKRRLVFNDEQVFKELKNWAMRIKGKNKYYTTNAFKETIWGLLYKIPDSEFGAGLTREDAYQLLEPILKNKFKDKLVDYIDSIFVNEDDNNKYCFIKHAQRNYDSLTFRGFSDCVKGWNNFLSKYGYWLPHLDWNEIHSKLNNQPDGRVMLLAKPLEGHNYEYYFSITKKTES